MLAGWFYVGGAHPYGYRGWGEIAAFVFFGPVATLGTTVAMAGAVEWPTVCASLVIGLVALAVLSVNNLRDIRLLTRRRANALWAVRGSARTRHNRVHHRGDCARHAGRACRGRVCGRAWIHTGPI